MATKLEGGGGGGKAFFDDFPFTIRIKFMQFLSRVKRIHKPNQTRTLVVIVAVTYSLGRDSFFLLKSTKRGIGI